MITVTQEAQVGRSQSEANSRQKYKTTLFEKYPKQKNGLEARLKW
jgi:hypothetical protein